jgi:hypothetical protein
MRKRTKTCMYFIFIDEKRNFHESHFMILILIKVMAWNWLKSKLWDEIPENFHCHQWKWNICMFLLVSSSKMPFFLCIYFLALTAFVNYKFYCLCRTLSPVAAICCLLFTMFLIALTIVLSLIPIYLPPRNLDNINIYSCMSSFLSFIFFA